MSVINFIVPGAAVGKQRPRATSIGGHTKLYTPAATLNYEGLVKWCARQALPAGHVPLEGPLRLDLRIDCQVPASWSQKRQREALEGRIMPTTKPDIDNVLKAICDALNGIVWRDDVQVVNVSVCKRYWTAPQVAVSIEMSMPVAHPRKVEVQPELLEAVA